MKIIAQEIKNRWASYHGDNCEVIKDIPNNSIHYQMFSPPFSSLFTYSDSDRDMGNSKDMKEFVKHFEYLIPELYRIHMPGRLISIHCMNLPATLGHDGFIGIKDFRGDIIRLFQQAGFYFHSEVMIWKDPLLQAVRTKALSLAHKQVVKDSAMCGAGLPDYIVTMRKPGINDEPVAHPNGFEYYTGDQPEPKKKKRQNQKINKYSHEVWQRYASPVWWDINQSDTLNIRRARDGRDEKHICPIQLGTVVRCLELWSNKHDTILDPFAGIASVGYQSLLMNRNFIGVELKESYYKQGLKNLKHAANSKLKSFFEDKK